MFLLSLQHSAFNVKTPHTFCIVAIVEHADIVQPFVVTVYPCL